MFSLGKKKKGFRFDIDEQVEYIGELKSKKGTYTIVSRKHEDDKEVYKCKKGAKTELFTLSVLKKAKGLGSVDKPLSISAVDERAKELQRRSGIKEVKKVTTYNLSRKEAKKIAFREARNK